MMATVEPKDKKKEPPKPILSDFTVILITMLILGAIALALRVMDGRS